MVDVGSIIHHICAIYPVYGRMNSGHIMERDFTIPPLDKVRFGVPIARARCAGKGSAILR